MWWVVIIYYLVNKEQNQSQDLPAPGTPIKISKKRRSNGSLPSHSFYRVKTLHNDHGGPTGTASLQIF